MKQMYKIALLCSLILSTACTPYLKKDVRFFQTSPLKKDEINKDYEVHRNNNPRVLWITTVSGGGSRASAFAYGVLEALSKEAYNWKDRKGKIHHQTLVEQIDYIRGTSGGSVISAYYALNGKKGLPNFRQDFLDTKFQSSLVKNFLHPQTLSDLMLQKYSRGFVISDEFTRVFKNAKYADLRRSGYANLVLVANDLSYGTLFEFTPQQFNMVCTQLDNMPVSLAVGLASSIPFVFDAMTFKNYAQQCDVSKDMIQKYQETLNNKNIVRKTQRILEERLVYALPDKKYIHLIDGATYDYLALEGVLESMRLNTDENPLRSGNRLEKVDDVVILVVSALNDVGHTMDQRAVSPDLLKTWRRWHDNNYLKYVKRDLEELDIFERNWTTYRQLLPANIRKRLSSRARLHVIPIELSDYRKNDPDLNAKARDVTTNYELGKEDVTWMIEAGKEVLEQSEKYQRLKKRLGIIK